ncbi:hypothetical protein [Halocatena halophila]|uniref:hypothetical protein n=1 Tax=Halocatena halophila TaxID=2814576 RepID=UPI002ECFDE9B
MDQRRAKRRRAQVCLKLVGVLIGIDIAVMPVAAQNLGESLCAVNGVGTLVGMVMSGLGLILLSLSVMDFYKGVKQGKMKSSGKRAQKGSYYEAAAKKLLGAVLVPGLPTVFSQMGFMLPPCFSAASMFGMVTPVYPVLWVSPSSMGVLTVLV